MVATKTLAIAIVAVMVVAGVGVGVYALANNNSSKTSGTGTMTLLDSNIEGKLYVYGNVDGDMDIDADDKTALQNAITAGTTSKLWKYADADFDGDIDADDLTKIDAILSATPASQVEVKHIQRYKDSSGAVKDYEGTSMYPITNAMSTGAGNMLQFLKQINVVKQISGIAWYSKVDSTLFSEYQYLFGDSYRIGDAAGKFNKDKVLLQKDAGVKTILSPDDYTYLSGDKKDSKILKEKDVEDLGIDVIRVACSSTDFSKVVSDLALIQFFFKTTTNLEVLQDWYSETISEMNKILEENVGEGKKYSVVKFANSSYSAFSKSSEGVITTSDAISKNGSDYTAWGYAAGGDFALKEATSFSSQGNGGSWLKDYDIDKLVVTATGDGYSWYGGTADDEGAGREKVSARMLAYYLSEPFYDKEVYVLSGDMPVIMRIIYCAHIYYPQLFSKEWADNINKDYSGAYFGLNAKQIETGDYYFSMNDLNVEAP